MATFNKMKEEKMAKREKVKIDTIGMEKKQVIEATVQQIEKQFGKGAISRLGSNNTQQIDRLSSDILTLDMALGGGLPKGRIIEIYGPESSSKTSLCLNWVAQTQQSGGIAAFVDAEHALDLLWANKLGVNIDDLLVAQPDNGEEALEITESLVRSNALDLIIVDSVAALVPRAELEGNMGDAQMGLHARLMSQALRKLTGTISKTNTTVIFVNQIRHKIGVMFGSPETTTGGNALKFYASVRMDVRKIEAIKKGDTPIGNKVRVKVVKNKTAPPFRQSELNLLFDGYFDKEEALLSVAVDNEIVEKSGTWYSYNGDRIGQGKDNVSNFLRENNNVYQDIYNKIIDTMQVSQLPKDPIPDNIDPETGEILEGGEE